MMAEALWRGVIPVLIWFVTSPRIQCQEHRFIADETTYLGVFETLELHNCPRCGSTRALCRKK